MFGLVTLLRRVPANVRLGSAVLKSGIRHIGNIQVPFQEDLTAVDDDFGLADFQHYQESDEVIAKRMEIMGADVSEYATPKAVEKPQAAQIPKDASTSPFDLALFVKLKEPLIFESKLTNPFLNLAIEDYVYSNMPLPTDDSNYNRLMFYVNSPCVVIGKNQNPWKEVNIPLLKSLHIPLVRRRSGGGTVVHDTGNVNYSFMTSKAQFDRFTFANLIEKAVNAAEPKHKIKVNHRGDIVTEEGDLKISGSAYKISRGKSYHHGTMLLSLKLDILRKLLHRDESLGVVDARNSISSVSSKVVNLEMESEKFISVVSQEFENVYGEAIERTAEVDEDDPEFDQDELFGFNDFIPNSTVAKTIEISKSMQLPEEVLQTAKELQEWLWTYGATPKFTHEITNTKLGFKVMFHIDKHAILEKFDVEILQAALISEDKIIESFEYLQQYIKDSKLEYTGSNVAGFITNDMISDWVGECIDGTI